LYRLGNKFLSFSHNFNVLLSASSKTLAALIVLPPLVEKLPFLSSNNNAVAHGSKLDPLPEKHELASSVADP
jgi:hypothetical protein